MSTSASIFGTAGGNLEGCPSFRHLQLPSLMYQVMLILVYVTGQYQSRPSHFLRKKALETRLKHATFLSLEGQPEVNCFLI